MWYIWTDALPGTKITIRLWKCFWTLFNFPSLVRLTELDEISCHVCKDSSVIWVILLPNSDMTSDVSEFQGPALSMAIGMKCCMVIRLLYFSVLLVAAFFAAAPALSAVSTAWEALYLNVFHLALVMAIDLVRNNYQSFYWRVCSWLRWQLASLGSYY